nr:Translation initiation factor IF-1 [Candidatus Pantoea persica]
MGGMYGLALGQIFCGESMFSRRENSSKTALWIFCQHFIKHQGKLVDCQILNPYSASLGAQEISRVDICSMFSPLPGSPSVWDAGVLRPFLSLRRCFAHNQAQKWYNRHVWYVGNGEPELPGWESLRTPGTVSDERVLPPTDADSWPANPPPPADVT